MGKEIDVFVICDFKTFISCTNIIKSQGFAGGTATFSSLALAACPLLRIFVLHVSVLKADSTVATFCTTFLAFQFYNCFIS